MYPIPNPPPPVQRSTKFIFWQENTREWLFFFSALAGFSPISAAASGHKCSQPPVLWIYSFPNWLPICFDTGKADSSHHSFIKPIQSEKLCPHAARKKKSRAWFPNLILKAKKQHINSSSPQLNSSGENKEIEKILLSDWSGSGRKKLQGGLYSVLIFHMTYMTWYSKCF